MSQVIRKYNSGGKSPEEPELFEWKDVGKYNKSDLISGLYRNVDTYITNNNLSGKNAAAFRTATSRLIDGIKNGTVTLNGDGTFNVSDKSLSSTGRFDKNFLGGEKNTDNNANNRAGDYVLDYIKSMNTYKKPTVATPKKEKFDFNKYFTGEVSRRWYGGNDIDNDNFFNRRSEEDRLKLMADIAGGITPEMLSGYDLEGTIGADEILNRSKRFVEAINNGTLDNNDYNIFAELGGRGLDRWLKPQEEQTATVDVRGNLRKQWEAEARQKGYTDEAIQAYIDNKQRALDEASQKEVDARNTAQEEKLHADAKAAEEERIRQLGAFNIGNYNTISTLPEVTPYNFEGVYKSRYDNPWSLSFSAYDLNPNKSTQTVPLHREDGSGYYDSVNIGKTVPGTTAAQRLANDLDYYIRAADLRAQNEGDDSYRLEQLSSGEYVIPDSYNPSTGLIRVYNPKTRQLRWVEALTTQTGKDRVEYLYNIANSPKYKAEGGILKAQQGNVIDWNALNKRANEEMYERNRQADQRYFESIEETKAKEAKTKAKESGKSEEQAINDSKPHTQWSKADITRMGALAGDVASLLASFTGVGSVASAGIGAASTAANQAADMMEGQSFGQALWNNAGSYVLDAISLIPFAKAAKVPRMIKNVGRFAPLMTTALATYQGLSNGREYLDSWNKVKKGESLTVGDWRNILSSLQLVLGGTAATHRASKAKSHVAAAVTGDEWVKTNQGYRRVSADKMKAIRKAKTLEEQNKILEGTGIVLPEAKTWTGKGKGVAKIPDTDKANMVYDFSKPVTTYSGDLPLQHKFGPGEQWLGTAQFPNFHLPGVRNAYNRVVHPQAYKRAENAKSAENAKNAKNAENAKGKNQSTVKPSELLALPAPNQVTPSNRVFYMGDGKSRQVVDITDPNKLAQTRAIGDRNRRNEAIRNERLNKQAEAREVQKAKNEALVAWAVNQPFPKQPLAGAVRTSKEKSYRNIFQPVAEREYNKVWDEAVKNRKDFGYEDMTPRRNIYAPPTPTEIFVTPSAPIKDKNARYLWELVNPPKRSTAHIKRELPKKKTKKKSKDDRVARKADGGLLIPKFQSPAAPIQRRNVRSADDLSWNNDILNSLGLKNTLGNITPANASKYNNMQGDYAKLGFGTSKPGDTSLTYDPNAAAYQTTFNNLTSVNQDTISDLVRRGRITGRGGSSDKGTQWTADGLKGDQTFLRHLGTAATTKEGMDVLKSLVPDDIDVIKNLNQGMVNFMPKLKMADGKGFNIPNTPIATTNNSDSYKLNTKGKAVTNVLSGLRTLPEDIIALGRMVGGLRANRRAADKYKEGLKPLLVDTYENVVPITGNYLAKVSADKQASNLTSLAARPRTSDGSLQLAGELEAGNRAAQMRFQGDMADADMFNRTRTLAQQESDAAKARRTDVANRNRASMLQIDAAKKQIDSARITNNYERVISPYLAGIEGRFRQNRAAGKQFDLEQARLASATKYRPQLQALQDRYLEAQKNNDQEGMKAAMNDYYRLVDAQNQEMLAQRKKLTQMPWLFEQVNPVQAKIPYNKSGAKMNSADRIIMQRARDFNKRMLEDNKQLHKNINESKKQQADLIKHMSSLTAELIKKGMSWK